MLKRRKIDLWGLYLWMSFYTVFNEYLNFGEAFFENFCRFIILCFTFFYDRMPIHIPR